MQKNKGSAGRRSGKFDREDSYERLVEQDVQFLDNVEQVEDQVLGKMQCEMLHKALSLLSDEEAAASIDPENEHLIQEAVSELTQSETVITIAHRLATVESADRILVV